MSEPMIEQAAAETPAAASGTETPRSPSEAVNLADRYAAQAQEIQDGEAAPAEGELPTALDLSEDVFGDDYPADYSEPQEPWEPKPGDAAYETWAQAELDRLRGEQVSMIAAAAEQMGVNPYDLAQYVGDAVGQRRAAAQQYAATAENVAHEHISEASEDWGAGEYVDPGEVLDIARQTHAEVARRYGPEVADNLALEIYDGAVRGAAAQFEAVADHALKVAQDYAPNAKDPVEVVRIAEEIYPRRLRELGDPDAAVDAAFRGAARSVGGEPTTPRQIRNLYAQKAQDIEAAQRQATAAQPPTRPQLKSPREVVDFYAAEARRLAG
jgi:hypothetical protein